MSRHRRGTLIIRPLTVREVDTTGLEPQITLLRSGLLGIDDVAALEESGALRRLVDAGVFDDQRILNLFYRLITPPRPTGRAWRARSIGGTGSPINRAWWARNKEEKNRKRREQYRWKCVEGSELRDHNRKRHKAWVDRTDLYCDQPQEEQEQS